jgi:hypothetical protein
LNIVARMAGLLAYSIFAAFPSPVYWGNSGKKCKKLYRVYSCGYSSGIKPDSLLIL